MAIENNIKEKIKLDKAYINYHDIIDKSLPYKFAYLDEWLLKESKLLLAESSEYEKHTNQKYKTYKRGTNETPRNKLRGIFFCDVSKRHIQLLILRILFTLIFHIFSYYSFILTFTYCRHKISVGPKLTTPQFFLYLWTF